VAVNPVRGNWTFVRVYTDESLVGLGEATHVFDPAGVERTLRRIAPQIIGRDPLNIEAFVGDLVRLGARAFPHAVTALSGIETALWDIKGQALGVPVYSLLGGKLRDRIRLYANLNRTQGLTSSPDGFAAAAHEAQKTGFTAVKFFPFYGYMDGTHIHDGRLADAVREEGLARVAAVRRTVGPDVDILLQLPPYEMCMEQVLELAEALSVYRPFWYQGTWAEIGDQATFAGETQIPVTSYVRGGFTPGRRNLSKMLCAGGMRITNPDLMSVGGLWEMKKIAASVEAFGVGFSPHSPYGPVHTVADAHLCATLPNFVILEYSFAEAPWRGEVITPVEAIVNGHVLVPDRPGLGITLNEAVSRLHPLGPHPLPNDLDPVWGTRTLIGDRT
jgi:galactonate dehydratase